MTATGAQVLVSHPGRQHSHQAAMALKRAGMLEGYWAGVPSRENQQSSIPGWLRRHMHRYAPVDLTDEQARWLPVAVALRRVGRRMPVDVEQAIDFLACRAFDWQVARELGRSRASAVMACEISALDTFRAAKKLGMKTILDAASVHYALQDRVTSVAEAPWLHERIVGVKQAEILLADHVLTVSEMARAGYVEAGVPPSQVHAVALGADTRLFDPGGAGSPDRSGPCTFLFVGATIHRKGIDVLLDAFGTVQAKLRGRARLVVVGPRGDSSALFERPWIGDVVVHAAVAQSELLEIYRGADCFVLPSRHDSFGMAVVEAMACGLPAIVSEMVGAREAIEEGTNGWVVPFENASALAERMAWCVENRGALAAMRPAARAAAERYGWDRYRERLAAVMAEILDGPR
jgi:glycosyltransferase involved in cell wall biosynthesis